LNPACSCQISTGITTPVTEKSNYFGIPPIVNSLGLSRTLRAEIQELFLDMHLHEQGREIMKHLQVDRFILTGDTLYDGIREARKFLEQ
jgi:phosphonate transport system substrate-binding protein